MISLIQTVILGNFQMAREAERKRHKELKAAHKRLISEYKNDYKKKDLDHLDVVIMGDTTD